MALCRKPGCAKESAMGFAYCAEHKAGPVLNIATPSAPMAVKVKEKLRIDREAVAKPQHLRREAISLQDSPLGRVGPPLQVAPPKPVAPTTSATAKGPLANRSSGHMQFRLENRLKGVGSSKDPENLKPMIDACNAITATKAFEKYVDAEVGWTNWSSWFNWAFRAAAPAMAQRPVTEEVTDKLRGISLGLEGRRDRQFASRFFFELSLYCEAQIEKMDIEFVFSQASMLFAPLLAPLIGIPGQLAGKAGAAAKVATDGAMKVGKTLVEAGAKAGLKAAIAGPEVKKYKNLNPMRYALALWKFCVQEKQPAKEIQTILTQFGGKDQVIQLWDWLECNNL